MLVLRQHLLASCVVLAGCVFALAQSKTSPAAGKPQHQVPTTPETQDACQQAGGIWRSGQCYLFLKDKIVITTAKTKLGYPTIKERCEALTGVWSANKCYLYAKFGGMKVSANQRQNRDEGKTDAEKCKERGGTWVVNKDGQGFCFELLKPDVVTLPRDTIK